jgi:tetratricopeptide (TPR) repeat protein
VRRLVVFLAIVVISGLGWLGLSSAGVAAPSVPPVEMSATVDEIERLFQEAFRAIQAGDLQQSEILWGQVIQRNPENAAAWSNRGNVRVGLNQLEAAVTDFDESIRLAPDTPNAYLNRGAALEGLGKWSAAIADYNQVLALNPKDAGAFNNRGNAEAALEDWDVALEDYRQAIDKNPSFALARVNYALALYQVGKTAAALHDLENIVRRYPQFADARAALSAALWQKGRRGEAESNWVAVVGLDSRYKDLTWIKTVRRWPTAIAMALEQFLTLQPGQP